MPLAAFTFPVEADSALVWRFLASTAEQPQRIDSSVSAVRVEIQPDGSVLRQVTRDGVTRRERVELDAASGSLVATLCSDADYRGSVTLRAEAANPSSSGHSHPRISGRLDWQPLSGEESEADSAELTAALQRQLLSLKHAAEALAAREAA